MALREELEKQGSWLFRWRSFVPLFILPVLVIALEKSGYLERHFGDDAENFFGLFCVAISLLGLAVRCITVGFTPRGTSGRNTKKQIAKTLNTKGMYSIVRNPLYLGNFLIFLGITLFIQVWWFSIISLLAFCLYYERIMFTEEEFLRNKFGSSYLEWAERTPLFLPKPGNWKQPDLPFSFRNVLKREYSALFVITSSFPLIDTVSDLVAVNRLELDWGWIILFTAGLAIYLTLRALKKKTKILAVSGR